MAEVRVGVKDVGKFESSEQQSDVASVTVFKFDFF